MCIRDSYERFLNPNASEKQMVIVSRALVLIIAFMGYFIALIEPPSVFNVVIFATSVLGSAFLPAYVCAVWWKKANTPGAMASIVTGSLVAFVWEYLSLSVVTTIAPMVAGVFCSSITMIVVSLLTQKKFPVPPEIIELIDEASKVRSIPKKFIQNEFINSNESIEITNESFKKTIKKEVTVLNKFIDIEKRIFNKEIYLFDHPYFGVIVSVSRI